MDAVVKNATDKRLELARQISELQNQLAKIDEFIAMYRAFAPTAPTSSMSPMEQVEQSAKESRKSTADLVADLISKNGPQHTPALLDALAALGRPVGGAKPAVNLASALSRDHRFVSDRAQGWNLLSLHLQSRKKENPGL